MIKDLSDEMHNFLKDLKENVKDPETLSYLLQRTNTLFDIVLKEVENIVDFKEEKVKELLEKQKVQENKIQQIEEKIQTIYKDVYDEEGDFEIICPYCNCRFSADVSEEEKEISCPECGNIIELDWSGNPDEEEK